jgi:hypothetical protein
VPRSPDPAARRFVQEAFLIGSAMRKALSVCTSQEICRTGSGRGLTPIRTRSVSEEVFQPHPAPAIPICTLHLALPSGSVSGQDMGDKLGSGHGWRAV